MKAHEPEPRKRYKAIRDIGREVVKAWGSTPAKAARALGRRHPEIKVREAFVTRDPRTAEEA